MFPRLTPCPTPARSNAAQAPPANGPPRPVEALEARLLFSASAGFQQSTFVSGLDRPTQMEFAPDGRLFVSEQGGHAARRQGRPPAADAVRHAARRFQRRARAARRRVRPGLRRQPFRLRLLHRPGPVAAQPGQPVHRRRRRGAPPAAGWTCSTCRHSAPPPTTTAARSTSAPTASCTSASARTPTAANAQSLATPLGKMLRINPDGSIPDRQPVLQPDHRLGPRHLGDGPAQPVHLRRPARHRPDVHQRRRAEHLGGDRRRRRRRQLRLADHRGQRPAGAADAGQLPRPALRVQPRPPTSPPGVAITGGTFYDPPAGAAAAFPASYTGDYFFADYGIGFIKVCSAWGRAAPRRCRHARSPPA